MNVPARQGSALAAVEDEGQKPLTSRAMLRSAVICAESRPAVPARGSSAPRIPDRLTSQKNPASRPPHARERQAPWPRGCLRRPGVLVELIGFEPTTSALQGRRSPN